MGTSTPITGSKQDANEGEGFVHFLAREGRVVLRWTVIASLVATIVTMATFFWFAVIPGIFLLISYACLLMVREVEHRSERHDLDHAATPTTHVEREQSPPTEVDPVNMALMKREGKTGLWILAVVGIAALTLAGLAIFAGNFMSPGVLAIVAFVLFAYMLLVMAPVWLGWIEDDIEDEKQRIEQSH